MAKIETLTHSQPQPDFSLALTRIAVAQICQSTGFASAEPSALRALTTVASLYLRALAGLAASRANRSSRTLTNLYDVVAALEDLHSVQGFPGQSHVSVPLLRSGLLVQIMDFVDRVDEVPFAQAIRRSKSLNLVGNPSICSSSDFEDQESVVSRRAHIPMWLPPLPNPGMYREEDKGVVSRRNGEILFPNGSCEETSVSGSEMVEAWASGEKGGKSGCERRELPAERCRVKFGFGAKRKNIGREVKVDLSANGVSVGGEVQASRDVIDQVRKEEEKRVCGRKSYLLNNGEKTIVFVRRRKCGSSNS
uniref:Bromodomain associated domain-containing protein n=1 Tax=Kalanchoe fedtschenkoi TaxID=63787 RepID=A0A7N0T6Z0_KALFE